MINDHVKRGDKVSETVPRSRELHYWKKMQWNWIGDSSTFKGSAEYWEKTTKELERRRTSFKVFIFRTSETCTCPSSFAGLSGSKKFSHTQNYKKSNNKPKTNLNMCVTNYQTKEGKNQIFIVNLVCSDIVITSDVIM